MQQWPCHFPHMLMFCLWCGSWKDELIWLVCFQGIPFEMVFLCKYCKMVGSPGNTFPLSSSPLANCSSWLSCCLYYLPTNNPLAITYVLTIYLPSSHPLAFVPTLISTGPNLLKDRLQKGETRCQLSWGSSNKLSYDGLPMDGLHWCTGVTVGSLFPRFVHEKLCFK
jgi:hypothetical protein